jgi:release factor glutamine methyltransferase
MYYPSDDTFLIANSIVNYHGNYALEIGVGSGYLTEILCNNYKFVFGTDLDFTSVRHSKTYLKRFTNKFLLCCDLCEPIRFMFDIIVSNPPYLPSCGENTHDDATDGGKKGIETTLRILRLVKSNLREGGRIIVLKSSLSANEEFNRFVDENLLKQSVLAEKKGFYENLEIREITKI